MTSSSRIILSQGHDVLCSSVTPPIRLIDGVWYNFGPEFTVLENPPQSLSMSTGSQITFPVANAIATGGIYDTKIVQELQESLEFGVQRNSLLNSMSINAFDQAHKISGPVKIFNEKDLDYLTQTFVSKLQSSLQTSGMYSSLFVATFILFWYEFTSIHESEYISYNLVYTKCRGYGP